MCHTLDTQSLSAGSQIPLHLQDMSSEHANLEKKHSSAVAIVKKYEVNYVEMEKATTSWSKELEVPTAQREV